MQPKCFIFFMVCTFINQLNLTTVNQFQTNDFACWKIIYKIPKTPNVVNRLTRMIYKRMITDEKYKPVIKTYVKQRIFIRIKFLNQNMISMCKIKRSKLKLQKLNKLRKIIT